MERVDDVSVCQEADVPHCTWPWDGKDAIRCPGGFVAGGCGNVEEQSSRALPSFLAWGADWIVRSP